jgi:GNAT superfamily N-acetyltransferase
MTKDEKIYLSDLNLAEYIRESARWNACGEIFEHNDALLTRTPGNFPSTSVAMNLSRAKNESESAEEIFDSIRSFYRERNTSWSIHIRDHADKALEALCVQAGMIPFFDAPGMAVEQPFARQALPQNIELRKVSTVAGVIDFANVSTQSYQSLGMPTFVGDQIFASPERLLRPHHYLVVAYEADLPVSAAMMLLSHGIAGIYWVGTLASSRGKGLGAACVRDVANEAFLRGAGLVVLQASKFGAPLYRKMGFEEITRYPWYLYFKPK